MLSFVLVEQFDNCMGKYKEVHKWINMLIYKFQRVTMHTRQTTMKNNSHEK